MGAELWLSPDEVADLTGKKRWTAQCRTLAAMNVPFTPNGAGRPLVERAAVVKNAAKPKAKREPNWDALKRKAA